jgi:hypothetical protein
MVDDYERRRRKAVRETGDWQAKPEDLDPVSDALDRLTNRKFELETQIKTLLSIYDSRPDRQYIGWQADIDEQIEALRALVTR